MMKNKNTSPLFHKVTIYGIGLIGGSLGLALKEHHLVHQVMGFDQNKKVLSQALEYGACLLYTSQISS